MAEPVNVSEEQASRCPPPEEQARYARLLGWGARVGMGLLLATYILYLTGIVPPYIPREELPRYWTLPASEFTQQADIPTGLGWITMLRYGDFLNFLGIALMGVMTVLCLLTLIPTYFRRKDWYYLGIVVVEIAVLSLAASGLLGPGGH